jgi:hypothetical protein
MTEPWWHRLPACAAARLNLALHPFKPSFPSYNNPSFPSCIWERIIHQSCALIPLPAKPAHEKPPRPKMAALFRNTRRPHPETSAILTASPEPHAETSGTITAPYGKQFRFKRPKSPAHQHNMPISHHNFFISPPARVTSVNYSINIFDSLLPNTQQSQKYTQNEKKTGFPTSANPCPFPS